MMIMMSPKIKLSTAVTITETTPSLTATAETVDDPLAYNQYTLVTLRGNTPAQLQTSFKTTAEKTSFYLSSFLIEDFSSLFAD